MQTLQEKWAGGGLGKKYHSDCCGATSKEDMTASLELLWKKQTFKGSVLYKLPLEIAFPVHATMHPEVSVTF